MCVVTKIARCRQLSITTQKTLFGIHALRKNLMKSKCKGTGTS